LKKYPPDFFNHGFAMTDTKEASYAGTGNGKTKTQIVLSNEGREYQFSPKRTFVVGVNEIR